MIHDDLEGIEAVWCRKKFGRFEGFSDRELEEGILHKFEVVFDGRLGIDERIAALERYLAMQYYLHEKRKNQATDPIEGQLESELSQRFALIFRQEEWLLANLWRYCEYNSATYSEKGREEESNKWADLADKIKEELLKPR
jgi:hypothetical protein